MIADKFAVQIRAALVAVALTGLAAPALAAQPSAASIAMAREIITLKGADAMFKPIVANIVTKVKDTFLQSNINLKQDIDAVALKLAGQYNPRIKEVTDNSARLYASQFTEQELKQLLAFYRSPLGKKVVVTEPKVIDQSLTFANEWAQALGQVILNQFRAEMKKRGHDL
jgi:hypothetical protein